MARAAMFTHTASFFVLRTPLLPAEPWPAPATLGVDDAALPPALEAEARQMADAFRALLEDAAVREALFVASPDLQQGLQTWLDDPEHPHARNVPTTLYRYLTRMRTRPTPFGLFAGQATGEVGAQTSLTLSGETTRHTRLDMGYLTALCAALEPTLRPALRYRPTPALATFSDQHRYAEGRVDPDTRGRRNDQVSVQRTPAIDAALAATPARPAALAEAVRAVHPEVSPDDALAFIDGLIDASVLVSALAPPITGEDPLLDVVATLADTAPALAAALSEVRATLHRLDQDGLGQTAERYEAITTTLQALPAPPDRRRLYHVDLYRPDALTIGPALIRALEEAVSVAHGLSAPWEEEIFQRFMARFEERWGEDERSLVEVLDDERGIGFGGEGRTSDLSPLLRGLPFAGDGEEAKVRFGPREQHRLRRLQETAAGGEWALSDADLAALREPSPPPLPDAFAVMATLAASDAAALDRGEGQLLLVGASGPSGVPLMGRFCLGDPKLRAHVEAHMRAEEATRPDAIFAELVYSPEGRLGNVICRPRLRPWEIPYLGHGAAPEDHQILVSDLRVRVYGGRIHLRSARLDRPVVPCLTSAHNFTADDLPIYRFLASVGRHGVQASVAWSWGPLASAPSLPRVRRGRIVLSLARWTLTKEELSPLAEARTPGSLLRAARALRDRRGLPRVLRLEQGDNVLTLDLERPLALDALASAGRLGGVTLSERWPEPEQDCVMGPGGRYTHEIVVPFVRREAPQALPPPPPVTDARARRAWMPGSDWLYLQIFCGSLSADAALTQVIAPLIAEARAAGMLHSWFYIRYGDPEWHLRVRLRAGDQTPALLARAEALLEPWRADGRIGRLRVDTYQPELERYGGAEGMALAERLFEADSDAALAVLALLDGDEGEDARWRLCLRALHLLLLDLEIPLPERVVLLAQLRAGWGARTGADKAFETALNARYRRERAALEAMIAPDWDPEHPLAPGFVILAERSQAFRETGAALRQAALSVPLGALVQSYAHMLVNRWMRSQSNQVEVVLYDLLLRLYKSAAARPQAVPLSQDPEAT